MIISAKKERVIDEEWLELILAAKKLGLTIEEVREFLHSGRK